MSSTGVARAQRLVGADLVRAVATIGVVGIHAAYWDVSSYDREWRFSVPAFVVLSGALLQLGYADRSRGVEFLRRRLLRSLLPWLTWAPVYMLSGLLLTRDLHGLAGVVSWLSYGTDHLWFLLLIPQLYLVFAVWPRQNLVVAAGLALAIQLALSMERIVSPVPASSLIAQLTLFRGFLLFPFWIGYFALGIALARWLRQPPNSARWIGGSALAVLVTGAAFLGMAAVPGGSGSWDGGPGGFLNPMLIPLVTATVVFLACAGTRWIAPHSRLGTMVRGLSEWSLAVYVLHKLLLDNIANYLLPAFHFAGWGGAILHDAVLIALGVAAAMGVAAVLRRTPLAVTLGLPRPANRPRP